MTLAGIQIKKIDGICFDKILGFTANTSTATIAYEINGKQRTITVESEAVEIEVV